jgi:hypothetical protein
MRTQKEQFIYSQFAQAASARLDLIQDPFTNFHSFVENFFAMSTASLMLTIGISSHGASQNRQPKDIAIHRDPRRPVFGVLDDLRIVSLRRSKVPRINGSAKARTAVSSA